MYATLFSNEHTRLCLICLFVLGFTVDNGGSQKTESVGDEKRGILKYYLYVLVLIIYIINPAITKINIIFG